MQQKLMEAQEKLANSEVHGQAGGGLVQVTMKGSGEVVGRRASTRRSSTPTTSRRCRT